MSEHESPEKNLSSDDQKTLSKLSLRRVVLPVLLGLAAIFWLFKRQFNWSDFEKIEWDARAFAWIAVALGLLVVRHLFYSARIRMLSANQFSWRKAIELMVIWEFSSALTPTSKGGPAVMLFVLAQEKVAPARSAAMILYAIVLDSMFFVLTFPLWLAVFGPSVIHPNCDSLDGLGGWGALFFTAFGAMAAYGSLFFYLLFIRPGHAAWLFGLIGRLPFLKKYRPKLEKTGHDFVAASAEIRSWPPSRHLALVGSTVMIWTLKFFLLNALILAFVPTMPLDGGRQMFVYARMVSMFVVSAFFVTPGGAGLVELTFAEFVSDLMPKSVALVVALVWRLMAYYLFLFIGAIVVPNWIARRLGRK